MNAQLLSDVTPMLGRLKGDATVTSIEDFKDRIGQILLYIYEKNKQTATCYAEALKCKN